MFNGPQCSKGKAPSGFTLVELLIVIAIFAILATLVLTSLGKLRESAERTKCAGNLRQIGIGAAVYAQDHNGDYPLTYDLLLGSQSGLGLIDLIGDYTGSDNRIFYCTDVIHLLPPPALAPGLTYNSQSQNKESGYLFHLIGYFWLISSSPSWDVMAFGDPRPKLVGSGKRVLATCPHFGGGTVHRRLYNVLFADGHVQPIKSDSNGELIPYISQKTLLLVPPFDQ